MAGIETDKETDLQIIVSRRKNVEEAFREAMRVCATVGASIPKNIETKGKYMLAKPNNTKAYMVFLRACARKEHAAIFCRKKGIIRKGKQTTQSLYKLLT
jgi:hypothetical protein